MKTIEMEVVLSKYLDCRQNLIVFNPSWGLYLGKKQMHECDILMLSQAGYATEIEIKVSKADLLKDRQKRHGHHHPYIKNLWFAVPEQLKQLALESIPDRAGLLVVKSQKQDELLRSRVRQIRKSVPSKSPIKWNDSERYQLARLGAIRAVALKRKLLERGVSA